MSAAVAASRVARPRVAALALQPRAALVVVAALSTIARSAAAVLNARPIYMPDEYLYAAIARSLAAGHLPSVRGNTLHFPGLLAPLLAAPLQAAFSPELAYRLTQFENAFFMSLAVVPVYAIARRLRLSPWYAVGSAIFAVAIPDLVYASVTTSDAIAYPLVLSALAFGLAALDSPRWQLQVAFLAAALLSLSARVQYAVLPAAYLAAAAVVDRRALVRRHAVVVGALGGACLVVLAAGPSRLAGTYAATLHFHVGGAWRWALLDVFFITCSTGAVLVPGAVAGVVAARGRREVSFAVVAASLTVMLVAEAALFAANTGGRFEERYLFVLVPLLPIAFGLYLRHARPSRVLVLVLGAVLVVAAAKVQLTGYVAVSGISDSPFLIAYYRVVQWLGVPNAAVLAAATTTGGAVGAMVLTWRGRGAIAFVAALVFVALVAGVAVASYARLAVGDRPAPGGLSWIDAAHVGDVTYVRTPRTPVAYALQDLYWNRSLVAEVRVLKAMPTDGYAPVPELRIADDGTLVGAGHAVAFERWASFERWTNGSVLGHDDVAELVSGKEAPRLSLLELGRFDDGWLANTGRITLWPVHGRTAGTLTFALHLPRKQRATRIMFGSKSYLVLPGRYTPVRLRLRAAGPVTIEFASNVRRELSRFRIGSVMSTPPTFTRSS